jgi:protein-tyrosine-phosphatase
MAEEIFHISEAAAGSDVEAASAGFMQSGRRPPREVLATARRFGGDLSAHLTIDLETALASRPDLILTMTRQQFRSLVGLDKTLLDKTFCFKEFLRLGEIEGPRRLGEGLTAYAIRVGAGRLLSTLQMAGREDDVADPIGKRRVAYEECARELESMVSRLILLTCVA